MKASNDIDALIGKFLAGEASPEEAMLLEDWKAAAPENNAYFDTCSQLFGLPAAEPATAAAWEKLQPQLQQAPIRNLLIKPALFRQAAAIAVLVGLGTLLAYFLVRSPETHLITAGTKVKVIELSDGTAITMAQHSSLEIAAAYGQQDRSLTLKGSAYFTVEHNDQLPFVVHTGALHIKDLGTKFDVRSTKDTIFIRVDEGSVELYVTNGAHITLQANESAHYVIAAGKLEVEVHASAKNETVVSQQLVFTNRRLGDVIRALEKAYGTKIVLANPQLGDCLITTSFSNEQLDMVLDVIAETLGVTVEQTGKSYTISGTSCVH